MECKSNFRPIAHILFLRNVPFMIYKDFYLILLYINDIKIEKGTIVSKIMVLHSGENGYIFQVSARLRDVFGK